LLALLFEERQKCLTGIFSLASGHPVFDQVADKIGILTPQAAQGVSEAYNIFTSVRLALILIGSETFRHVPDRLQVVYMTTMADMFLQEVEGMHKTVTLLDDISRQGWFSYLAGRNPSPA
jgi:hypothetical protein